MSSVLRLGYLFEGMSAVLRLGCLLGSRSIIGHIPFRGVPEGRVYSRRLVFVSVRTIKRHHHHRTTNTGDNGVTSPKMPLPRRRP
jgi:hypothetical protein